MAKTQSGWDAAFYKDAAGTAPVKDFLLALEKTDPDQVDTVYRKIALFGERGWEESVKCGLLKHVEGKIFEIKVKGEQVRILGFAWRRLLVAAAAEIKKRDDLDPNTVEAAEARRIDWINRQGE